MRQFERTLATARVLLDEATRIYRGESGGEFTPEEIIKLVQQRLAPYKIGTCYNPVTLEIDIRPLAAAEGA